MCNTKQLNWLLFFLLSGVIFNPLHSREVIHTERSLYRNISVVNERDMRCLIFESRKESPPYQTCIDLKEPKRLIFSYTKLILSGLLYQPDPQHILVLGLGGGTLPMTLTELLPRATITSVEIDPAVIKIAKEYFNYRESDQVRTVAQDARLYVKRAALKKQTFDWIILDAFNGDYIPEHLMTQEFLQEVKSILSDKGIVTANTFSSSQLYAFESATYHSVFGEFYNIRNKVGGNRIILATKEGSLKRPEALKPNAESFAKPFAVYGVDSLQLLRQLSTEQDWDPSARILTDQYAPANLLKNN
jgi:spermidine synthase